MRVLLQARQNLYQLAQRHHLHLTEWRFGEAELLPVAGELLEPYASCESGDDGAGNRLAPPVGVTP